MRKERSLSGMGIYHIHFDCFAQVSADFEQAALDLRFYNSDFGHPSLDGHRMPVRHLTFRTGKLAIFHEMWKKAVALGEQFGLYGYLEGELVFSSELIAVQEIYNPSWQIPFQAQKRPLTEAEQHRQTEVHLTWRREGSDERVWCTLSRAGMNIAVMLENPHDNHFEIMIATLQGHMAPVRRVKEILKNSLPTLGGMADVAIDEEIVMDYYFFGEFSYKDLPSIVCDAKIV